jgi:signal transduction histidine kinase
LLQVGDFGRNFQPGERIQIRHDSCLLRKREMGVELCVTPLVMNDGLHAWMEKSTEVNLRAGLIPIRVEWFNFWRNMGLGVFTAFQNASIDSIAPERFKHAVINAAGETNFAPGLVAECFEGSWDAIPDFNLLKPVKSVVVATPDLTIRSRDERVGIRFSGHLEIPVDGRYRFVLGSDDGSLLYLGDTGLKISSHGLVSPPVAKPSALLAARFNDLDQRRWMSVEGRVSFPIRNGEGARFDLGADRHVITVHIADATGLDLSALQNSRVRVSGVGRAVAAADTSLVLGKFFVANAGSLVIVEPLTGDTTQSQPLTSVAQVQSLPIEQARKALPVRIRGTVTGAVNASYERWMSFQDETRGIFVRCAAISNATPVLGEIWELEGESGAGDFAPIINATKLTRIGEGLLPTPTIPSWAELLNGSRDVQWAELTGLATDVRSNILSLQLTEGRLDIELDGYSEPELKPFEKSVLKIRGVLYAVWDSNTRQVQVGRVMMRNALINVDTPAPTDPFSAVLRSPRELLLFDAQASTFRPVRVRGQIVYADSARMFLQSDGTGLKVLPVTGNNSQPGDDVEVVGYPDIGRTEIVIREALVRRLGNSSLPQPFELAESTSTNLYLNATRVRVEGKLLGWHTEQGGPVLEMQSGNRLFLARLAASRSSTISIRPGSRLALVGVYVGRRHVEVTDQKTESFELLMSSANDISTLSKPSWWTLPRLFVVLTVLIVILIFTVIWNRQLRRQVEQRTTQLQHEIRERERLERHAALETERSRIARDLHDDLGSSLTEISVLASTGQLPQAGITNQSGLFQSISTRARSLIAALDVIVWAVDPEDNSLQSLADYLTGYTNDYFSHTQIACRFKVPVSFPPITLEGRVRHDLLMVVKESLNNIVRHAEATELEFRLEVVNSSLEIDIADNGKGIESGDHSSGHGLKNLSARLKNLGGQCSVERRIVGGTIVKIRLPLTAAETNPAPAG